MVLRDPELHARNDDNDITLSPCSVQVVINHNSTKQLFESNETHHKMTNCQSVCCLLDCMDAGVHATSAKSRFTKQHLLHL